MISNIDFDYPNSEDFIPLFGKLQDKIRNIVTQSGSGESTVEIDMLLWMSRFALQAIGQAGFSYNFNALENDDDEYALALKTYL